MLFCGCFMTSIAFWPAMATQGDSSLHSIFTRDGLVKEGKHEDKARNFLLLVLCGSKSREATCNRDRERGPLLQPRAPTDSALKFTGTRWEISFGMCGFQLECFEDVYNPDFLFTRHWFHQLNSYKCLSLRSCRQAGGLQGFKKFHLGSAQVGNFC